MSLTQQLLDALAIEPDLPTVLQKLNLTLEQAHALLNSPEGRHLRQIIRNTARIQCELIAHRSAPKTLHKLTTLATTSPDDPAKPETQLRALQSLLKSLTLKNLPIKPSHHALPTPKNPHLPAPPSPLPPAHAAIVQRALQAAAAQITALNIAQNADPPPP